MSADKHRGKGLEIDAAYLSLAAGEWGLSVNRRGAHILTDRLKALSSAGLVRMERLGSERSKTTRFRITDAGAKRLGDLRRRHGADFGRHELIGETEYRRWDQAPRRQSAWETARRWAVGRRNHKERMERIRAKAAAMVTHDGGTGK